MIKSTEYCNVLNEAFIMNDTNEYKIAIEKILVKDEKREEIRFCYYKENLNGNLKLVIRPLDVTEDELFNVIKVAIDNNVIDNDLCSKIKSIISNSKLGRSSEKPLRETDYCDLYAIGSYESQGTRCSIENILVKDLGRREIRFSYYKLNKNNNYQLVTRPLDVTKDEFVEMFKNSILEGVFSKVFLIALENIL